MIPSSWWTAEHALETIGAAGFGVTAIWGGLAWMASMFKKLSETVEALESVSTINKNVETILTNHLPHLQSEVGETRAQFQTLRNDIKGIDGKVDTLDTSVTVLGTKLEATQSGLHTLGQMFIAHIDKKA